MMKKRYALILLISILAFVCGVAGCARDDNNKEADEPTLLQVPQNITAENRVVTWDIVENATGYLVEFAGTEYEVEENRFELYFFTGQGNKYIRVKAIGDGVKYNDSNWAAETIKISALTQNGYDEKGFEFTLLEDKSGYELSCGNANLKGNITLPGNFEGLPVKCIADNAFNPQVGSSGFIFNRVTTGIVLPKGLKSIGQRAFNQLTELKEIVIPDTVTEIGTDAFARCFNLTNVKLPRNLKEIPERCFLDTKLSSVVLPDTLEIIGAGAFAVNLVGQYGYEGSELSSVVIPASVNYIGADAFKQCEKLKDISFVDPYNLEWIGSYAFSKTAWYEAQADGLIILGDILCEYKGTMPENYELTIPSTIKAIVGNAFSYQINLRKVTIPTGVRLIGDVIFCGCSGLEEVSLPSDLKSLPAGTFGSTTSLKSVSLPDGLTEIERAAFSGSVLESIVIPSSVKTIGDLAFYGCESLTEIVLPDGLTEIGREVFTKSGLKSINIPSTVKKIGYSAFRRCKSLTEIVLPDGVEYIGNYAFEECTSLTEIVIPAAVKELGIGVFIRCENLTSVYYEGTSQQWNALVAVNGATDGMSSSTTVYFYSETEPTESGNYWHFDGNGKPLKW
ncbi:MAG: leucine-rich repeat domain-containing protein [Clostridiales bacterium]|nr:leucine-rich repeat domain-containing protein [Clostridiales bacterium]MDY5726927.1 leucine-rich repeat domain-containing protein [Eubacteriales bacterium]